MIKTSLFYRDPYNGSFDATVLSCEKADGKAGNLKDSYLVVLSETAFYPEGGGEPADKGFIGDARVFDVHEKDGTIVHLCSSPLETGAVVPCSVDMERRLKYMRHHTGEHIFTGCLHHITGATNVGFHMGDELVTVDFDIEVSKEDLLQAELMANKAVMSNIDVTCLFPSDDELRSTSFRQKKELDGDVRLVHIDGIDCCACCGLHVAKTGEVGLIKATSYMRYKSGCRITLAIGLDALFDYQEKQQEIQTITALTSAKPGKVADAVSGVLARESELKGRLLETQKDFCEYIAKSTNFTSYFPVVFVDNFESPILCFLADCLKKQHGIGAAFSSDNKGGFRFAIADEGARAKEMLSLFNAKLSARGGGDANMVQGSVSASKEDIQDFFKDFIV